MLYPTPTSLSQRLANIAGAALVGVLFAWIGLNVASGCGQRGGACIAPHDLVASVSLPPT
jgi:hypothetical protein